MIISDSLLFFFFFLSLPLFAQETKIDCVRVATKGRERSDCVDEDVFDHMQLLTSRPRDLRTNKINIFK